MTAMIVDSLDRIPMSPSLAATLKRAAEYASTQAHIEVTLEHLLLALTEDPEAGLVMATSHIDVARLSADVSDHIGRIEERFGPSEPQDVRVSADLRRILSAAAAAAQQGRRREINGAIVLAAIVGDGKSAAAHMLRAQGLTFEEAIKALQRVATQGQKAQQPGSTGGAPQSTDEVLASARERVQSRGSAGQSGGASGGARDAAGADRPGAAEAPAQPAKPSLSYPEVEAPAPTPAQHPASQPPQPAPRVESAAPARERPYTLPEDSRSQPSEQSRPMGDLASLTTGPRAHPPPDRRPTPEPGPILPVARPPQHQQQPLPAAPPQRQQAPGAPSFGAPPGPQPHMPPLSFPPMPPPGQRPPPPGLGLPPGPPMGPPSAPGRLGPPPIPPAPPHSGQLGQRGGNPTRAAPPWPDTRELLGRPQGPMNAASAERKRAQLEVGAGQLVENIPRMMRVGRPSVVEVRIAKADVKAIAEGLQGGGAAYNHDIAVTKAMSVRLRAPLGGFFIETASPETQWIENTLGLMSDDFASWRWTVTPRERGKRTLQVIVSARTVGTDGLAAETALPDQIIEVRIRTNYALVARRWAGWAAAAAAGGLIAKFGEERLMELVRTALQMLAG